MREEFLALSTKQQEIWRGQCKPHINGLFKFKSRVKKDLCSSAKLGASRGALRTKSFKYGHTTRRLDFSGIQTDIIRAMSREEFLALSKRQREIRKSQVDHQFNLKFKSRFKEKKRPDLCPSAKQSVPRGAVADPQFEAQDNTINSRVRAALGSDSDVTRRKCRRRFCVYRRKSKQTPIRVSKPLPPVPQQAASFVNIMDSIQTQTSMQSSESLFDHFPEEILPISFILYSHTTSEIPYPETPYPDSPLSNR